MFRGSATGARARRLALALAIGAAAIPLAGAAGPDRIAMPEGWRLWPHVKTLVLREGHPLYADFGGIHHVYANPAALEGLRSGRYPDGAVLVFDLFEAAEGEGTLGEGPRKVTAFMVRDAERFAATGGWGFEAFAGGDPARPLVGDKAAEACFACHEQVAERGYVFSAWRE
ncbi:MAG: cytochrome C [Alphaproteobacteria bacterium]|nr:MAG: cytochrome C [Alphaproteobacteria bacterium]